MESHNFLDKALEENASEIADILSQAAAMPSSDADVRRTLVESGFALAWRQETGHPTSADSCFSALIKAVKDLDERLLAQPDAPLQQLRNSIADTVSTETANRRSKLREGMVPMYGASATDILMRQVSGDALTDAEAFEVGFSAATTARSRFYGFCVYSEDTSLRCRCPEHVAIALVTQQVSEADAEAAMLKRFGDRLTALRQFGRWFCTHIEKLVSQQLGGDGAEPGAVDTEGAHGIAQGFLTRLMGAPGGPDATDA